MSFKKFIKKIRVISVLGACFCYHAQAKADNLGILDIVAVWFVYKGWCYWLEKKPMIDSHQVIGEMHKILNYLRHKITDEQRAIDECKQAVALLKKELEEYTNQQVQPVKLAQQ